MSGLPTTELLQEALALHRRGAVAEAAVRYAEVLRVNPANADAHYYLATISCQQGRFAEGANLARRSLASDPRHARAHMLLGRALNALGQHEDALASFGRAIAIAPDLAPAHGHRADVLSELGRYAEAIESYDRALESAPEVVEDWFSRGVALAAAGRQGDAVASFERAIAGKPDFAEAHLRRAKALSDLRRHDEALEGVDKALTLAPDHAEAWLGRGNVLTDLKRYDDASTAYDRALGLKPDLAGAWLGRGNVLRELKRHDDALAAYERALTHKPDLAGAWLGRGNVLFELKQYDDALTAYDRAVASSPYLAAAWHGRGNVLTELTHYAEALAALDRAFVLKPGLQHLAGQRLYVKRFICDWTDLESASAQLLTGIRQGKSLSVPFPVLSITSSATDQLRCAQRYVQDQPFSRQLWHGEMYSHDRIRVGYLSSTFHEHPTIHLAAGLFEQHDKSRFEVTGISFGPDFNTPMRQRLRRGFEHFVEVHHKNDHEIAELIRRLEIDIAVDLVGFTKDNRPSILAQRPAPIQVNYLGFPGTMGASYMDYIIADRHVIPPDQRALYTEKVVYLPGCYQANDRKREIGAKNFNRAECGLPQQSFVFCCFNNAYKITPDIFDCWMRILKRRKGSVLWLLEDNAIAVTNLRKEAAIREVSPERLVFAKRMPLPDHLARHRLADLFLDTLPYNAHTTASDALWTGLPVLTQIGQTFAGSVAASLLCAIDLPELVVSTREDYEELAVDLATNPDKLAAIKNKLANNRMTTSLFDTELFKRRIEAVYTAMYDRYQSGLPPDHIDQASQNDDHR
jgi:predicted O-linked N-acetylglucosamine transferase (SPINDLY family)